jgi:hypothetical protein
MRCKIRPIAVCFLGLLIIISVLLRQNWQKLSIILMDHPVLKSSMNSDYYVIWGLGRLDSKLENIQRIRYHDTIQESSWQEMAKSSKIWNYLCGSRDEFCSSSLHAGATNENMSNATESTDLSSEIENSDQSNSSTTHSTSISEERRLLNATSAPSLSIAICFFGQVALSP